MAKNTFKKAVNKHLKRDIKEFKTQIKEDKKLLKNAPTHHSERG